jgi:hypothetical protein
MQLRKYLAAPFAALLLTGASLANAAAPIDLTWNPSGAGITTAGAFTFDNVLINTYANIDITSGGTTFSEQGFAKLVTFSNNGIGTGSPDFGAPGGTPYSLYIVFTATGTQTAGVPSTGTFSTLDFSLLGASGVTTFTPNGVGVFSATGGPTVTLATGHLTSGTTTLSSAFQPSAQILTTFSPNPAFAGFFVNPNALTQLDLTAAFTNTNSVITQFDLGGGNTRLSLNGGGGNATFSVSNVPEPDTYGMLLAGLGLFAFIARRKSNRFTA